MLVDAGGTRILVDAGFGVRTIAQRLAQLGCAPESISALVLTHEHVDHAQGAIAACARWGWPLFATSTTLAQLPTPIVPVRAITHGHAWSIGDVVGTSYAVPHDANDCAAFVFEQQASGERLGIALDLGHVPESLPSAFERLDMLVVEANHDLAQLMAGPYPWVLKQRIRSSTGHLSNEQAATFIAACAHKGLRAIVLAHLSETNNSPEQAVHTVGQALAARGRVGAALVSRVVAASQRVPLGPVSGHGALVVRAPQLELSL
jgi:phosphoribosyl 1,2-cyclic phosphodiesterase